MGQSKSLGYVDIMVNTLLRGKIWEPVATSRDRSVRELKYGPHHIRHRFSFKGGISGAEMLALNVTNKNALYTRLKRRST